MEPPMLKTMEEKWSDKERKKRKDMREKTQRTPRQAPQQQPKAKVDYAQKQKEALEKLKARGDLSKPAQPVESKPVAASSTVVDRPKPVQRTVVPEQTKAQSRDDHLAELKEKSAATAQFAKEAKDAKVDLETEKVKDDIIAEQNIQNPGFADALGCSFFDHRDFSDKITEKQGKNKKKQGFKGFFSWLDQYI